ncbi:hypothetical protein USB125703_00922 [Pseudoclavibacter triregionum]|nr:hypothetical protein USB125703_00922 [Pseudoclavibacter triregionum]
MLTNSSAQSTRTRATALALAFGIVAGGAAIIGAPAYAATETPAPTADASATPVETTTPVEAGVATDKPSYTMDEFMAGSVNYFATGFAPEVELEIAIVAPDGTTNPVNVADPIIPGADGSYSGSLTPTGTWPEGNYVIVLATKDKSLPQQSATAGFTVGTVAPTPTETATPTPERVQQGIITNGTDNVVDQAVAQAEGVQYLVTGFLPGAELVISGTEADGSEMVFDSNEAIVVDGEGNASGYITGDWPTGFYTITITDPATGEAVTISFEIAAASATPAPSVDTVGGGQQAPTAPQLAETGAEAFGPAGLALATLVAGAGVLVASRRLAK